MILVRAENLINDLLQTDPELLSDVAAMAGKVIAIELVGPEKTIYIIPQAEGVLLQTDYQGDVHACIKGSPFALLKLARSTDQQPTSFNSEVEISGDLALGQHLQQMMKRLDLDWEELLSHKVGDVAAHQIGNALRGFSSWAKEAHTTIEQNIGEYVRIEAELTPDQQQIEVFMNQVEDMRNDVDRLEQRINRLRQSAL